MAIYHFSCKTVSRASGSTATGSAAYRSAEKILDERTGEIHDFTRKGGVEHTEIVLPDNAPEWAADRGELWNHAEAAETRKNSTVAREFEVALPEELTKEQRIELARDFTRDMVDRYGFAADVAIHEPEGREKDNPHAHILCTTRRIDENGLGEKTRELDERKSGEVDRLRESWAEHANRALERAGHDVRIDHRSLEAQGIDRTPEVHMGPHATAMERRGIQTERGDLNRAIKAGNQVKEVEQERRGLDQQEKEKGQEYKEQRAGILESGKGRMDYYKDREARENDPDKEYRQQVQQAAQREQGRAVGGYDQYKQQQEQQRQQQRQKDRGKDKGRGFER